MVPEGARKNADGHQGQDDRRQLRHLQAGELKDNTGKVVIPKGKAFKQTDLELEGMNYLVEGVIGSI
jgi:simple sugar transport system substrate-binding protein